MGRCSTGAETCEGSARIELSSLLKAGYLRKGCKVKGSLNWQYRGSPSGNIGFESVWSEDENYIRLIYTLTERNSEEAFKYDYKVFLTSVPSNLGKGNILYFLCPVSGKRCRVLYRAYGSQIWKSRGAYENKLYYSSQLSSKMSYANDRFWNLDRKIEK
ncbi:MAG: hypothetical protein AAF696_35720, partial [Bacteroidota bacterium]